MIDLRVLAKHGVTPEKLKALFTSEKPSEKVEACIKRVSERSQDGLSNSFRNYKVFYAIDQAWDTPFLQTTATLVRVLADSDQTKEHTIKAIKDWGLTHLMTDEVDPKTNKPTGRKRLNSPVFTGVLVPLVRAYVTIRAATITNDRMLNPLFKYEPLKSTPTNRARCELVTDRIQTMSVQYGYADTMRQAILKQLIYGTQLQFIQEEWHSEEQLNDSGDAYTVKEGLRYHLPHPTRAYVDGSYPLSSLNTDCGCEFAGYWRVRRFGDVRRNGKLWNTDKIAFSNSNLRRDQASFFNTVYGSCVLNYPQDLAAWSGLDRESNQQTRFYSSTFDDAAVTMTEHFEKLIPKEDGLGDYPYPVWFRFVLASEGTILYAAPLPDKPAMAWQYDPDESRSMNASLALETLPFQDEVSNLLTQTLISVRQNLTNITFVDDHVVEDDWLRLIENPGEAHYRKLNLVRINSRRLQAGQNDIRNAFGSVRFPQLDVTATINAINVVLNILERVLVMSAQEAAAAASHELREVEAQQIARSTSTRLAYTSSMSDRAIDAWKQQLYAYMMAYGDEDVLLQFPADLVAGEEQLATLGFKIKDKSADRSGKHLVEGKKTALQLEYFASTRDGNQRTNNIAMANAMVQMLASVLSNAMMQEAIGADQAISLMNKILEQMGVPRDFILRSKLPEGAAPGQQQEQVKEQLLAMAEQFKQFTMQNSQAVLQKVDETVKTIGATIQQLAQRTQQGEQAIGQLTQQNQENQLAIAKITEILQNSPQLHDSTPIIAGAGPGNPEGPGMAGPAGMPSPPPLA